MLGQANGSFIEIDSFASSFRNRAKDLNGDRAVDRAGRVYTNGHVKRNIGSIPEQGRSANVIARHDNAYLSRSILRCLSGWPIHPS